MTLSTSLQKVASKLMAKLGGEVTLCTVTPGAYNTTTGAISETTSDNAIRGVLEDINKREVNELIQAGDKRLTIAAADVAAAPSTADRVIISSITHQIIRVTTIEQDSNAITYELILRA